MRNLTIIFLSILITLSLHAQEKYDPETLERLHIKEIQGYIFEGNSKTDSFLITKEYFNQKGRRTKIEIHDSLGIRNEYSYKYKNDTLRIERITKSKGAFSSRTKISYDKKNREIKAVDYDINNKKTGTYSKTRYNDRKLIEETKIYFSKKLSVHTKKKFDKNHVLKAYLIKKNGKWINQMSEEGAFPNSSKTEIEDYKSTGVKLIRVEQKIDEQKTILGIMGRLTLTSGDIVITENYINKNGLTDYQKQYLNGKLIATKKNNYISQ